MINHSLRIQLLQTETDWQLTVADVRKWLDRLDELNVEDSTPVDGTSLSITVGYDSIEKIECGECMPIHEHSGYVIWFDKCRSEQRS